MLCKLCLQDKKLVKSHIIPDFMYKGLFDIQHNIQLLNSNDPNFKKNLKDGLYEFELMCANCDNNIIGKLETYVSIILYGGNPGKKRIPKFDGTLGKDGLKTIKINNIDYTKTKLFLLSILWRSHISNLHFFNEIQLGPYAEKIRKMLLNTDAGNENELETALVFLKHDSSRKFKSIVQPRRLKFSNNTMYVFYINEIIYHFNISSHNKISMYEKGCVKKNDTMSVAVIEGELANNYFDQYLGKTILNKKNLTSK